jgi:predicted transcriptional regulator
MNRAARLDDASRWCYCGDTSEVAPMSTTSLKLSDEVKQLALEAAEHRGVTPHAFMVEAIRSAATSEKLRAALIASALAARDEALESGKGFDARAVHTYARARIAGKSATKPQAKSWRK